MPCIVFILDTSGSMSTKAHNNLTFFQIAQNYIELFIRTRSRGDATRGALDRYVLLTTSERYPDNIKLCGKDVFAQVHEQLRLITPHGVSQVHNTVLDAFKFMHVNRSQTAIDGYGWGRTLQHSENVVLILLTSGPGVAAIPDNFKLELEAHFLGSELTKEAYRWDQKLFSVVFRIPPTPVRVMPSQNQQMTIDIDTAEIERLCALTGGRSLSIRSPKQIYPSIEMLLSQVQVLKVGVRFECHNTISRNTKAEDLNKIRQRFRRAAEKKPVTQLLLRNQGGRAAGLHYNIPESFWPTKNLEQLQPRDAHPVILVGTEPIIVPIRSDVAGERIDIEPPSVIIEIAAELLMNKKDAILPVYVANSSNKSGALVPFGGIRFVMGSVALFLHGWNFPQLYSLIDELKMDSSIVNNPVFKDRVNMFLSDVPVYQCSSVKKLFAKYRVTGGKMNEADSMSATYSPALVTYLNKLKAQGKEEFDRVNSLCALKADVSMRRIQDPIIKLEKIVSRNIIKGVKIARNNLDDDDEDVDGDGDDVDPAVTGVVQVPNYNVTLCVTKAPKSESALRNPFDVTTMTMVSELTKMEANCNLMFRPPTVNVLDGAKPGMRGWFHSQEDLHNLPIACMGNYDEYVKGKIERGGGPLREVIEAPKRREAFGNPYKVKNLGAAGVDEVMDSQVTDGPSRREKRAGEMSERSSGPPKRKKGPITVTSFSKWREMRSLQNTPISTPTLSRAQSPINGEEPTTTALLDDAVDEISKMMKASTSKPAEKSNGEIPTAPSPTPKTNGKAAAVVEVKESPSEREDARTPSEVATTTVPRAPPPPARTKAKVPELTWDQVFEMKKRIGEIIMNAAVDAKESVLRLIRESPSDHYDLLRFAIREARRFQSIDLVKELEQLWSSKTLPGV